jgi:hypothetical protein
MTKPDHKPFRIAYRIGEGKVTKVVVYERSPNLAARKLKEDLAPQPVIVMRTKLARDLLQSTD